MPKLVSLVLVVLVLGFGVSVHADPCQCSYTLTQDSPTVVKATVQIGACDPGVVVTTTYVKLSVDGEDESMGQGFGTSASTTATDPAGSQTFCATGFGSDGFEFVFCNPSQVCRTF